MANENEYTSKDIPVHPRIEKVQNDILDEVLEYAVGEDADADEIEEFYSDFVNEDGNYLVEGAVLTCDRATTELKQVCGYIFNNTESASIYEKKTSVLVVSAKNASYYNGFKMATIKNHQKNVNVFPFKCNCEYGPNNNEEIKDLIDNAEECKRTGTCQQLMKLEDDWENIMRRQEAFHLNNTIIQLARKILKRKTELL